MKMLHRPDLFGWSRFDETRDLDFHSVLWSRPQGNVAIDPLPMSEHDIAHAQKLGGVAWIVITNSDHVRAAEAIAARFGARVAAPKAERERFGFPVVRWLGAGDELVPGLQTIELHGSKTPGELALLLEETTLICGDLIRAHRAGRLAILPETKIRSRNQVTACVQYLAGLPNVEAVLVGDGWPVFRDGHARLQELWAQLRG
jgi:glyoxylase-like metal-dependent hydrolase (beta-lactamase superfamily II)